MAKLILSLDGTVLREVSLEEGRLRIGRKPHNDLQIDNLAVSGEHAAIETHAGVSTLEDLQSTNGTLVNGELRERHTLADQDLIEIGKYTLKYMQHAALQDTPAGSEAPAKGDESTSGTGVITVLSGGNAGRVLELTKNLTSIGKPGVQVAIITRRPAGYFLTHVEGPSHPFVNETEIGLRAHELNDGDVIELVGVKMQFSLR